MSAAEGCRPCPSCKVNRTVGHFFSKGRYKHTCRVCRHREAAKLSARARREKSGLMTKLELKQMRTTSLFNGLRMDAALKHIKTVYLQETAVTRTRIRAMEGVENPKRKTEKALNKRISLLARYDRAYAKQVEMVKNKLPPPSIRDMIA